MNSKSSSASMLNIKYIALQSIFWITYAIIGSFATVYMQDKGFINSQVGLVLSTGAILSIVFQSVIASIVDRYERITQKAVILFLFLILLVSIVTLGLFSKNVVVTSCSYIMIFTMLYSLVSFLNSFAMEYINLGIDINYGLARGIGSVSYAVVAPVIGVAIAKLGSEVIIPISIVLAVLMIFMIASFQSPNHFQEGPDLSRMSPMDKIGRDDRNSEKSNIFSFLVTYRRFFLLLIGFALLFISHAIINTYHINILRNVGGDSSEMGISLAIAAALELPTLAAFRYLSRKAKCSTYIMISAGFFLLKSLTICLAASVSLVYLSQSLQMVSFALFTPAAIFYVNNIIDKSNRVKGQAILGAATTGCGNILGNFIGGRILDATNVNVLLITGVLISFAGLVVTFLLIDRNV